MSVLIITQRKAGSSALTHTVKEVATKSRPSKITYEPSKLQPQNSNAVTIKYVVEKLDRNRDSFDRNILTYDHRIMLVRDPRDTLISLLLYYMYEDRGICGDWHRAKHVVQALRDKRCNPTEVSFAYVMGVFKEYSKHRFTDLVRKGCRTMLELHRQYGDKCFLYRFEDMAQGNTEELSKYLGRDVTVPSFLPDKTERVVRSKASGNWRNWFHEHDNWRYCRTFDKYMKRFNYERGKVSDTPFIHMDHAEGYVVNLINRKNKKTGQALSRHFNIELTT